MLKDYALNIQTEYLENQTARFTVEIEPERFNRAKQKAARKIAKSVRIPGFRKGKAPYRILVQQGLEPQIAMEAVDTLGQEVYREALEQSEVEPYGPGAFEDYRLEPTVTFIYTVPLQPTVELNDYQSIRLDYEPLEIDDEMVDRSMKSLQEQEALAEESQQPAVIGNRITADIHGKFADDAPDGGDDNAQESDAPEKGATFLHEHDATFVLDPDYESVLPGFAEAVVGAEVDSELEFELIAPDDDEDYEDIAGRKISFSVDVKKIEVITLPELNDDLAARITQNEEEPLTLLQLRMRVRENLEKEAETSIKRCLCQ